MKSGVYRIQNILTGDFYIGSSSRNVHKRWQDHKNLLSRGKHHNIHLQRAWDKYSGYFVFGVVEYCSEVLIREQFYLDTLYPKYNIHKNARNSAGIKRRSETIEKVRQAKAGKYGGINHHNYGKKRDPETIQKMSETMKRKFAEGKAVSPMTLIGTHSEATRAIIIAKNKGNSYRKDNPTYRNIVQYSLSGEAIALHTTARIAADSIGRFKKPDSSKILRACRRSTLTAFGYKWKFADAQVKPGELLEA